MPKHEADLMMKEVNDAVLRHEVRTQTSMNYSLVINNADQLKCAGPILHD